MRQQKIYTVFLHVPSNSDIHEVYRLLEKAEGEDIWDFEEGHCGHSV
jgi:hypothetical protein